MAHHPHGILGNTVEHLDSHFVNITLLQETYRRNYLHDRNVNDNKLTRGNIGKTALTVINGNRTALRHHMRILNVDSEAAEALLQATSKYRLIAYPNVDVDDTPHATANHYCQHEQRPCTRAIDYRIIDAHFDRQAQFCPNSCTHYEYIVCTHCEQ